MPVRSRSPPRFRSETAQLTLLAHELSSVTDAIVRRTNGTQYRLPALAGGHYPQHQIEVHEIGIRQPGKRSKSFLTERTWKKVAASDRKRGAIIVQNEFSQGLGPRRPSPQETQAPRLWEFGALDLDMWLPFRFRRLQIRAENGRAAMAGPSRRAGA